MDIIKRYMNDNILRYKLNSLTQEIFGFDFENWVTNGYYQGDYIPYSVFDGKNIISNASANIMKFNQQGKVKSYIQIGTVMTAESYRNRGLARRLIKEIIAEYTEKCDGFYLFGDLSAVGFYQKLGFKVVNQYSYKIKSSIISNTNFTAGFKKLNANDKIMKEKYLSYVKNGAISSALEQINKFGLQMFYTSTTENVYYSEKLDCFAVADIEETDIFLHSVLYQSYIPLGEIISELQQGTFSISLGFTPLESDKSICDCKLYDGGADYRLFCLGSQLNSIGTDKLFFPTLSHA